MLQGHQKSKCVFAAYLCFGPARGRAKAGSNFTQVPRIQNACITQCKSISSDFELVNLLLRTIDLRLGCPDVRLSPIWALFAITFALIITQLVCMIDFEVDQSTALSLTCRYYGTVKAGYRWLEQSVDRSRNGRLLNNTILRRKPCSTIPYHISQNSTISFLSLPYPHSDHHTSTIPTLSLPNSTTTMPVWRLPYLHHTVFKATLPPPYRI